MRLGRKDRLVGRMDMRPNFHLVERDRREDQEREVLQELEELVRRPEEETEVAERRRRSNLE